MKTSSSRDQRWKGDLVGVIFTSLAAILAVVAGYVWILMCLAVLSVLEQGGIDDLEHLGVDYTWAFALDSICLGLLIAVIVFRRRPWLSLVGLALAIFSFALRLSEAQNSDSIFWFEPYLRSGIYAFSFMVACAANVVRRMRSFV